MVKDYRIILFPLGPTSNMDLNLRVLLVKWPDICTPTFLVQYLFGCIIKSTYLGDVPKAKSWDLGAYTGLWGTV